MPNGPKYFLKSRRLGFRGWTKDDVDIALGLLGDPMVTEFIDSRGKLSVAQVKERLDREIALEISSGVQYWPVFLLENDDHVGCCGLKPYDPSNGIYELGFHIRYAYWRSGFASETARRAIEYAFDELSASGLFAGHHPKNVGSRKLLEKLGFRYTHHEFYKPTGLDHPGYMLTARQYAA